MSYNTIFQNVSCAIRAVLLKQEFAHVYCHASIFGCSVIVFIAVFCIVMSHPTSATGNEITEFHRQHKIFVTDLQRCGECQTTSAQVLYKLRSHQHFFPNKQNGTCLCMISRIQVQGSMMRRHEQTHKNRELR